MKNRYCIKDHKRIQWLADKWAQMIITFLFFCKRFTVLFSFVHVSVKKMIIHSHIQEMARNHLTVLSKRTTSSLSLRFGLRTFLSEWGHSCSHILKASKKLCEIHHDQQESISLKLIWHKVNWPFFPLERIKKLYHRIEDKSWTEMASSALRFPRVMFTVLRMLATVLKWLTDFFTGARDHRNQKSGEIKGSYQRPWFFFT